MKTFTLNLNCDLNAGYQKSNKIDERIKTNVLCFLFLFQKLPYMNVEEQTVMTPSQLIDVSVMLLLHNL